MTYFRKTVCPYDCPSSCGLEVETDGRTIIATRGDKDHPLYHGLICRKMQNYERAINNPDRILTPLKRTGEKGSGSFVAVSWEEAIKDITDKWKALLKTEGPDSIIGVSSSGNQGIIQKNCVNALFNKIGARRIEMTLCSGGKDAGYAAVTGGKGSICPTEMKDSDYIIVWSSAVSATRIHTLDVLRQARKAGKKTVLIEVCAVDDASHFDEVILVKPGTDGALALGMMNVIVREGLADEEKMKEFAHGYEQFKATLPEYTPEWVASITGVPAETIVKIAREFAAAKAPCILHGNGNTRHANGGMTARLITILSAITGKWGEPGAGYCGRNPNPAAAVDVSLVARPDFREYFGITEILPVLVEAVAPSDNTNKPPVKAIYISGSNPVNSTHDQIRMIEGLKREDLFTVVHEQIMTDTAMYADYILPAAFSVEATDCFHAYGYCSFGTSRRIIDPPGECKSNWDTVALLAQAMGYDDEHFKMTDDQMLDMLLKNHKNALDGLTDEEWKTLNDGGCVKIPYANHLEFSTPEGKFMIVNEALDEPVPRYIPVPRHEYPLSLIAVPSVYTINTVFFGRPDLIDKRGPQTVFINPKEAEIRGINDGDEVIVRNDLASMEMKAAVTELVSEGCAAVPGVYSKAQSRTRYQLNALHHSQVSDIGHGTMMNGNFVDVIKCC